MVPRQQRRRVSQSNQARRRNDRHLQVKSTHCCRMMSCTCEHCSGPAGTQNVARVQQHTNLPHRSAQHLSDAMRPVDEVCWPHDDRAHRRTQPLAMGMKSVESCICAKRFCNHAIFQQSLQTEHRAHLGEAKCHCVGLRCDILETDACRPNIADTVNRAFMARSRAVGCHDYMHSDNCSFASRPHQGPRQHLTLEPHRCAVPAHVPPPRPSATSDTPLTARGRQPGCASARSSPPLGSPSAGRPVGSCSGNIRTVECQAAACWCAVHVCGFMRSSGRQIEHLRASSNAFKGSSPLGADGMMCMTTPPSAEIPPACKLHMDFTTVCTRSHTRAVCLSI